MNRTVEQWAKSDPHAMAHKQSRNAIEYAFKAAREDILNMAAILRRIAYPSRDTSDEEMTIYDAAKLIQDKFSLDDLEENSNFK